MLVAKYWGSADKWASALPARVKAMSPASLVLLAIMVAWAVLIFHNARVLPQRAGFDHSGHVEYIGWIQQNRSLPSPTHGWETFQQPLYYALSSAILSLFHQSASSFEGVVALRHLSLGVALAHLFCIFAILRMIFPNDNAKQSVGLVVTGFMPMHLYLAHYVTNEILAAGLMCATLFFILKLVTREAGSIFTFMALGLCFGLALLSKVTAIILGPLFIAVLIYKWYKAKPGASRWSPPALAVALALSCFGWRSWQLWRESGHWLFCDPRWTYGVSYFQDPGFYTFETLTSFGSCLNHPYYGGLSSWLDGVYSTVYGDGLWGGVCVMGNDRPPWDYSLMAVGYLLALLPTTLIFAGLVVVALNALRKPEPVWLVLMAFSFCLALALLYWSLSLPTYAVARGIYCLSGLAAIGVFCALGWQSLTTKFKHLRGVIVLVLLVWAMTNYASLWIRADPASTQAALAKGFLESNDTVAAVACLERAFQTEPTNKEAHACLFNLMAKQGRAPEAAEFAAKMLQQYPTDPSWHLNLARALEAKGQLEESLEATRRAIALGPDSPSARMELALRLAKAKRYAESIAATREALRILPAEQEPHLILAKALLAEAAHPGLPLDELVSADFTMVATNATAKERLVAEAIEHLHFFLSFSPDHTETLERLAWILATSDISRLRDGRMAVQLAERGCKFTKYKHPALLLALAAAYAETGQKAAAMATLEQARLLLQDPQDGALWKRYRFLSEFIPSRPPNWTGEP
ncbi:MAG TPA: tetratricopeptide repeat protein [Verrucomicrobiae bacterium]